MCPAIVTVVVALITRQALVSLAVGVAPERVRGGRLERVRGEGKVREVRECSSSQAEVHIFIDEPNNDNPKLRSGSPFEDFSCTFDVSSCTIRSALGAELARFRPVEQKLVWSSSAPLG